MKGSIRVLKALAPDPDPHGAGSSWGAERHFLSRRARSQRLEEVNPNALAPDDWERVEYDPREDPLPPWMYNTSPEYEDLRRELLESAAPDVRPCRRCGGPVLDGYCCERCGSEEP